MHWGDVPVELGLICASFGIVDHPPSDGDPNGVDTLLGHGSEVIFDDPRVPMVLQNTRDVASLVAYALLKLPLSLNVATAIILLPHRWNHPLFEDEPRAQIASADGEALIPDVFHHLSHIAPRIRR